MEEMYLDVLSSIESIVGKTDLNNLDKSGSYEDLPEGYYLCEVEKAELTTAKSSGAPMFKITFNVVNAKIVEVDDRGYANLVETKDYNSRKLWKNYPIKEEKNYQGFVRDMCELAENGNKVFNKEMFAIESYKQNIPVIFDYAAQNRLTVFVQVQGKENPDGTKSTFNNVLKWDTVSRVDGLL